MKGLISILLTLFLVLSLSACSENKDDSSNDEYRGSITQGDNDQDSGNVNDDSANKSDNDFDIGETSGNTWKNDYIGVGFKLSSSWSFLSNQEIAELYGYAENFVAEEYQEAMKNSDSFVDMYAQNPISHSNVNVALEKMSASKLKNLDEKEYLSDYKDDCVEIYESMGYTNVKVSIDDVKIDGKVLPSLEITAKYSGDIYYTKMFLVKCSNHIASFGISTYSSDEIDDLLESFYWL